MLFGPKSLQNKFVSDMETFCETENLKPIFASVLSSVGKGMQTYGSDYDARGLYVDLRHPEQKFRPELHEEKELRKRFYPKTEQTYEWIGLWEYTSFFQFLATPSFQGDFSIGLYRNVPSSLFSPYAWDPYGIVQKIESFVRDCYNPNYMTQACMKDFYRYYHGDVKDFFHQEKVHTNFNQNSTCLPSSFYLKSIYEMLALDWMMEYNTFHPWYFKSMLPVLPSAVKDEILGVIDVAQRKKEELLKEKSDLKNIEMTDSVLIEKSPLITQYFKEVEERLAKRDDIQNFKPKQNLQENVDYIHYLIHYSVFQEIQIQDLNKEQG